MATQNLGERGKLHKAEALRQRAIVAKASWDASPGVPPEHSVHEVGREWFEDLIALYADLCDRYDRVPAMAAGWSLLAKCGEELQKALGQLAGFPNHYRGHPTDQDKEAIVAKTRSKLAEVATGIAKDLGQAATLVLAAEVVEINRSRRELESAEENARAQREGIEAQLASAEEFLKSVNAVRQSKGVEERIAAFESARKSHESATKTWLRVTVGLGVALGGFAIYAMACGKGAPLGSSSWHVAANLSHFAPRLLLVSLLSYLLVVSVRNYRAARHNAITNEHRSGALQTFESFSKGAAGTKVADAVVLQVSLAAFAPQATGFDDKQSPGISTHITELLAALKDKKDD